MATKKASILGFFVWDYDDGEALAVTSNAVLQRAIKDAHMDGTADWKYYELETGLVWGAPEKPPVPPMEVVERFGKMAAEKK